MLKQGMYFIRNKITKVLYVGVSTNTWNRFSYHKSALNRNKHNNPYLQHSWNKHGSEAFHFKHIISVLDYNELAKLEQKIIEKFIDKGKKLYNIKKGDENCLILKTFTKHKRSDETKARMSKAQRGLKKKPWTLEQRKKIIKSLTGRKQSPESKQKQKESYRKKLDTGFRPKTIPITFNNETRSIIEWSRKLGIDKGTLRVRIIKWGVEKALTTPVKKRVVKLV